MDTLQYRSMNEQIAPSQELIQSTLDKAHQKPDYESVHIRQKKWIVAFAIFLLVLITGIILAARASETIRAGGIRLKPTHVAKSPEEAMASQRTAPEIDEIWIKATATNGKIGYIYGPDGDDEENQPKSPEEAVEYMKRMETAPDRVINVYAEDKKTVIGVFIIKNNNRTSESLP